MWQLEVEKDTSETWRERIQGETNKKLPALRSHSESSHVCFVYHHSLMKVLVLWVEIFVSVVLFWRSARSFFRYGAVAKELSVLDWLHSSLRSCNCLKCNWVDVVCLVGIVKVSAPPWHLSLLCSIYAPMHGQLLQRWLPTWETHDWYQAVHWPSINWYSSLPIGTACPCKHIRNGNKLRWHRMAESIGQLTLCQVTGEEIETATKLLEKACQKLRGIPDVLWHLSSRQLPNTKQKRGPPPPTETKNTTEKTPCTNGRVCFKSIRGQQWWSSKNTDHGMDRPLVPTKAIADEILRNAATLPVAPKGNAKTLKLATPAFWFFHGNA